LAVILMFDAGGCSSPRLYELLVALGNEVRVVDSAFEEEDAVGALTDADALAISGRRRASSGADRLGTSLTRAAGDAGIPIVGVCYGAQLINNRMGGTLELMGGRLMGLNAVRVDRGDPAFSRLPTEEARFYEARARRIRRLGRGLRAVAWSGAGGVEAYSGDRVYGFLFHPELSGGAGVEVMRGALGALGLQPWRRPPRASTLCAPSRRPPRTTRTSVPCRTR
jgi:GMP synthase-like glutamine amidotransferase